MTKWKLIFFCEFVDMPKSSCYHCCPLPPVVVGLARYLKQISWLLVQMTNPFVLAEDRLSSRPCRLGSDINESVLSISGVRIRTSRLYLLCRKEPASLCEMTGSAELIAKKENQGRKRRKLPERKCGDSVAVGTPRL